MGVSMATTPRPQDELPDTYDDTLPVEQLVHGEHNPRRVAPTPELRESIRQDGLQRPLIVRPDPKQELYHITDGWQRYQATTELGWERLPVRVYETPLGALEATESESIVREWTSYEWAQYCRSVASELEADSQNELSRQVARRTVKSPKTVRRYLHALALPEVVHPLLQNGPDGTDQQWLALANHNEDVRRYAGFSWRVGARLGRHADDLLEARVLGIAAQAVEYDTTEQALEFVQTAIENPETPLSTIHQQVTWDGQHNKYLELPRVIMKVEPQQKEALMEYCAGERRPLPDLVEGQLREFIADL